MDFLITGNCLVKEFGMGILFIPYFVLVISSLHKEDKLLIFFIPKLAR
jgi:hypothetical protein